jgi:hypothetical protein
LAIIVAIMIVAIMIVTIMIVTIMIMTIMIMTIMIMTIVVVPIWFAVTVIFMVGRMLFPCWYFVIGTEFAEGAPASRVINKFDRSMRVGVCTVGTAMNMGGGGKMYMTRCHSVYRL